MRLTLQLPTYGLHLSTTERRVLEQNVASRVAEQTSSVAPVLDEHDITAHPPRRTELPLPRCIRDVHL